MNGIELYDGDWKADKKNGHGIFFINFKECITILMAINTME